MIIITITCWKNKKNDFLIFICGKDEKRQCSNKNVKRIVGESSREHNEVNSRGKVC